jgi:hypothetical protein
MIERKFRLVPFPAPEIPEISLSGTFTFAQHFLTLQYCLSGNLESVRLPPTSPMPGRRDELWKETCFEFFLAIKDRPDYWEFNLSPSGDWNVYRMDAYRRIGFREETAISQLPFEFRKGTDGYSMDAYVDLASIIESGHELQMAVTAILQACDGKETYWALAHPAPQPDFHAREGFILPLEGQTHPWAGSAPDG